MKDIEKHRKTIDEADRQLVQVLSERAEAVLAIGEWKRKQGISVYDPNREARIIKKICRQNNGPLDNTTLTRLFERVIDEFRHFERTHMSKKGGQR